MALYLNDRTAVVRAPDSWRSPVGFHRSLEEYQPTPLLESPALAKRCGLGRVLIKYEGERFGLPAFKILGASWATYRLLAERLGFEPTGSSIAEIAEQFAPLRPLTLVTATDGNHGRAVARAAQWFGLGAEIFMPAGSALARIQAIESEGATVTVVDGDYDAAVAIAAERADDTHLIVSDTSWDGYSTVPTWIAEGYETLCVEIDEALSADPGADPITHLLMPVGVGALAVGIIHHWPQPQTSAPHNTMPTAPVRIAVEPETADCLFRSLQAGRPVPAPGPHSSMMAGMNCGNVSPVAWPIMAAGVEACITISDEPVREAMQLLATESILAGETGAATLGALIACADGPADDRSALGLGPDSVVLCLCTESATDPTMYEEIVGRSPAAVRTGRSADA